MENIDLREQCTYQSTVGEGCVSGPKVSFCCSDTSVMLLLSTVLAAAEISGIFDSTQLTISSINSHMPKDRHDSRAKFEGVDDLAVDGLCITNSATHPPVR